MSWQSYVDDQLIGTKVVKHAAIFGHDGNIWAKDKAFKITTTEAKEIVANIGRPDPLMTNGVTVAGDKFMYLSGNDKTTRAKLGHSGVIAFKTTQAVVLGVYEDPMMPEQADTIISKLGEFLISVGY